MAAKTVETGSELLARLGTRVPLSDIVPELFGDGPQNGAELLEFFGEEGTGKTELLLDVITRCVLPKSWRGVTVGGPELKVVFISTDYKFSILRLVFILEKKITKILQSHFSELLTPSSSSTTTTTAASTAATTTSAVTTTATAATTTSAVTTTATVSDSNEEGNSNNGNSIDLESEIQSFTDACLQRVYIVYCLSSWQLFLTLHGLECQLTSDSCFSLIIIDSISTFYWQDRFCANDNFTLQGLNISRVCKILKKFIQDLNISVIATKMLLFKPKYDNQESSLGASNSSYSSSSSNNNSSSSSSSNIMINPNSLVINNNNPNVYNNTGKQFHVKYLDKNWENFVSKRFTFTVVSAANSRFCLSSLHQKALHFTISDCGIKFL